VKPWASALAGSDAGITTTSRGLLREELLGTVGYGGAQHCGSTGSPARKQMRILLSGTKLQLNVKDLLGSKSRVVLIVANVSKVRSNDKDLSAPLRGGSLKTSMLLQVLWLSGY
jgi:hypothetical protein